MKKLLLLFVVGLGLMSCEKEVIKPQPEVKPIVKPLATSFHTDHLDGYDFVNISDSLNPSYEWSEFDSIHNCGTPTNFVLTENVSYLLQLRHSQNGYNLWTGYVKRNGATITVNQINGSKTLTFNCGGVLFID